MDSPKFVALAILLDLVTNCHGCRCNSIPVKTFQDAAIVAKVTITAKADDDTDPYGDVVYIIRKEETVVLKASSPVMADKMQNLDSMISSRTSCGVSWLTEGSLYVSGSLNTKDSEDVLAISSCGIHLYANPESDALLQGFADGYSQNCTAVVCDSSRCQDLHEDNDHCVYAWWDNDENCVDQFSVCSRQQPTGPCTWSPGCPTRIQ